MMTQQPQIDVPVPDPMNWNRFWQESLWSSFYWNCHSLGLAHLWPATKEITNTNIHDENHWKQYWLNFYQNKYVMVQNAYSQR